MNGMNSNRLVLRIVNDVGELSRIAQAVDRFCAACEVPAPCTFKINVALEELLMNTISYGFTDSRPHEIMVTIVKEDEAVVIEISDDGRPFDPLQAPPPAIDAPIETRQIGGLGIHFVRTMMDTVEYRRVDDRNLVTLSKRIASDGG